jgi:hypothetical protein
MPPRWLAYLIVAFWLTTCYWLFRNDIWPALRPGEPPPYAIDLVDEAQQDNLQVRWNLLQNGRPTMSVRTTVLYREKPDDTFALEAVFTPKVGGPGDRPEGVLRMLKSMTSTYRIGRRGDLREMVVALRLEPSVECDIRGIVRDGQFTSEARLATPFGTRELTLPTVPVSYHGSVMQPLHPVNRILGLRPGRSWRMPVFDPFAATLGGDALTYFDARVLSETKPLSLDGREFRCRVIEYRGDDREGATWVEERSGLVLRQDARMGEHLWTLERQTGLPGDDEH